MTNHRQEWLLRFMFDFVNFEKWVEWYGGEAEWSAFPGFGKFFRRGLQNVPSRAQKFTFCNYCLQHLKKLQLMFWIQNSFLWEKNSACKSIFIQHIWIMSIATTPFCEIYFWWFLNQQCLGTTKKKFAQNNYTPGNGENCEGSERFLLISFSEGWQYAASLDWIYQVVSSLQISKLKCERCIWFVVLPC